MLEGLTVPELVVGIGAVIGAFGGVIGTIYAGKAALIAAKTKAIEEVNGSRIAELERVNVLKESQIAELTKRVNSYRDKIDHLESIIGLKDEELESRNITISKLRGRVELLEERLSIMEKSQK